MKARDIYSETELTESVLVLLLCRWDGEEGERKSL